MRDQSWSECWARIELGGGIFRDMRLSSRMVQLAKDFSENPTSPINEASEDAASTKAAYRFFSNPKVRAGKILEPHVAQTLKRIENYPLVLAVQDTTALKYHSHVQTTGLGEISNRKGTAVQGLLMHSVEALTADGLPLGFIDQIIWARPTQKTTKRTEIIEEKESFRWLACLRKTAELTESSSARVVTVCDREADLYEFFLEANLLKQDVLVRCFHNREVNDDGIEIWDYVKELPVAGTTTVEINETRKRDARTAEIKVKYGTIEIHPPDSGPHTEVFSLSVVYVKESAPPQGEEALEWLLLTTLQVNSFSSALEKIKWYKIRWSIELFHRLLKSGLNVESCRLGEGIRLMRYLTLMTIVAWRLLWMTYVQRTEPSAPATMVLSEVELKVLYYVTHKKNIPKKVPLLKDAIHWIARKGGFLDRKGDGEPGMIVLWRGWSRLIDMVQGFEALQN